LTNRLQAFAARSSEKLVELFSRLLECAPASLCHTCHSQAQQIAAIGIWTSEGVDSQSSKLSIVLPDNPAECGLATPPMPPPPPKVNASPAAVKPN